MAEKMNAVKQKVSEQERLEAEIVFDLMNVITQTAAYANILNNDPMIGDAIRTVDQLLGKLNIDDNQREELDSAIIGLAGAYGDTGILYGMRVARAMEHTVQEPFAYSAAVLEKTGRCGHE